jgi:Ca2+-binding RTX toxin-like protein
LVKSARIVKHIRHSAPLTNIPTANILIKGVCVIKHPRHISHLTTARQYLIDTYHWTINGGVFDGNKTIKGGHDADTLHTTATKTTLHVLGGNDTLTGGTTDDILVGGANQLF